MRCSVRRNWNKKSILYKQQLHLVVVSLPVALIIIIKDPFLCIFKGLVVELFTKKQKQVPQTLGIVITDWKEYYESRLQSSSPIFPFQLDPSRLTGGDLFLHIDFALQFTSLWRQLTVKQKNPQVAAPSLNDGSTSLNVSMINAVAFERALSCFEHSATYGGCIEQH